MQLEATGEKGEESSKDATEKGKVFTDTQGGSSIARPCNIQEKPKIWTWKFSIFKCLKKQQYFLGLSNTYKSWIQASDPQVMTPHYWELKFLHDLKGIAE